MTPSPRHPPGLDGQALRQVFRSGRPRLTLRVLVVDDDRDAADTLGIILTLFGADVRVCYDGLSALKTADAFAPDAGLLDVSMTGIDGCDLARQLRAAAMGRRLLLVAVTGLAEDDRTRGAFDRHFSKPADPVALLGALSAYQADLRAAGG